MKHSEDRIQQESIAWFRNTFCLAHHEPRYLMYSIPNDGKDVMEQMRKKATGMLPGASDTVIDFGFTVVYCEFKDDRGTQKEAQKKFQQRVEALGREYWLVRDLETFKSKVYGILDKGQTR